MALFKKFVKALTALFKGPDNKKKKRVRLSTTQTRYQSKLSASTPKRVRRKSAVKPVRSVAKKKVVTSSERKKNSVAKKKTTKKSKTPQKSLKPKGSDPKPSPEAEKLKVPKPTSKEFYVGDITHFFPKISVVVLKIIDYPILVGDHIHIKGSTDFYQEVDSLQVESKDVRFARKGELVGLKVLEPAKPGDKIYKFKKRST